MSDPETGAGSPGRGLPQPTFFDPSFERLPGSAAFDESRTGPVVLLFDPRSDRAWAADAAVAIATGWTAGGRRTVLADLSLDDPVLHDRIGVSNLDGVVDVFLYGASLARSARPVPGRGFYLITAGTYTPEPGAILRHPRWEKLVAGFRDAGASLLLFAPADAPEVGALRPWAGDAILLGDRGEGRFDAALGQGFSPRAWLTPPVRGGEAAPRAGAATPSADERFPQPEPSVKPWMAPPREPPPPPAELPGAQAAVGAPAAALPVPDPTWDQPPGPPPQVHIPFGRHRRTIPKQRKVSPLGLVLLVILLIALAVILALQFFPGVLRGAQGGDPARPAAAAAGARAGEAGTLRPYAVWVSAYPTYEAASRAARQVEERFPNTPVFVFPEETQGVLWQKVTAGMAEDTAEAAGLRTQLVESGLVDPQSVGGPAALIQPRPLAFDLGDFDTRGAAAARARELSTRSIYAYPVAVPLSDGRESWKLYAGAFADSASAGALRSALDAAQVPARLVQRAGRPPASPK
ncbi:MAG TPA: hypothetical protein VEW03_10500 [Longimicrobiaceae bacterium]|nr:hypothetical protein [Longimicrobiaceae bacterium]